MNIQKILCVAITLVANNYAAEKNNNPSTPQSPLVLPATPRQLLVLEQEVSAEETQKHRQTLREAVRLKGAEKALFEHLPPMKSTFNE